VPDSILGLKIGEACDRHDCGYYFGKTEEDKEIEDMRMLVNIVILINGGGFLLRYPRIMAAIGYYEAVRSCGDDAYWKGKEDTPECKAFYADQEETEIIPYTCEEGR